MYGIRVTPGPGGQTAWSSGHREEGISGSRFFRVALESLGNAEEIADCLLLAGECLLVVGRDLLRRRLEHGNAANALEYIRSTTSVRRGKALKLRMPRR
jgi:hypothetical protein